MTTACAVWPWFDRGLSDEAVMLRNIAIDASDFGNSISLGELRQAAHLVLIQAFNEAREENWDGMGSAAVEATTFAYASKFLDRLPSGGPFPEISVDRDGEVCFDWESSPRQVFTVCIGRDGTLTYAGLYGHTKSYGVEYLTEALPQIISANIKRVSASSIGEPSV